MDEVFQLAQEHRVDHVLVLALPPLLLPLSSTPVFILGLSLVACLVRSPGNFTLNTKKPLAFKEIRTWRHHLQNSSSPPSLFLNVFVPLSWISCLPLLFPGSPRRRADLPSVVPEKMRTNTRLAQQIIKLVSMNKALMV